MRSLIAITNRSVVLIFILCLSLSSCYYKPFIGYKLNRKGFKNFSKSERAAGDNANPARDYKLNRYDWEVRVFPDKKRISGSMDIHFTTRSPGNTFLFDLQKRMKIKSFSCSGDGCEIDRKGDLLHVSMEGTVPANTRIKLSIEYEGKPANVAGEGPMQWKEDKLGRPWISTVTEGIGPQFIMPCNALLSSEPDSSTISITVPEELTVAANGNLVSVQSNVEEGTKTFKHEITNNINTYSLSFNIGHFVKLTKPYTDIKGVERELEFHVLDYNQDTASVFYDQTPRIMEEFEKMYGEFPFWEDGCKFIESTFSAMEHQSGIAMGSEYRNNWKDFNTTLIHELSHEWWGNSLSGKDYCDIWIHEGMATFSEALFIEKIYGKDYYELRLKFATRSTINTIPILKECGVLYNSWVNPADQDIYGKGALMMHSLRTVVNNDSLFLSTLHNIQADFPKKNVSTDEMIATFNRLLGDDYTDLFDWYLKREKPPILDIFISKEEGLVYYKWKESIPFYAHGEIYLKQEDETATLIPTLDYQTRKIKSDLPFDFLIEGSIYFIPEYKKKI